MSTEINIKKKLAILDEGASVTTDATSIDFVGSGVNASTVDGDVTITIPGGSGNTTYYLNQTVNQAPYKEFSSIVASAVEQVIPLTVLAGATSVIAEYQTPSNIPGTTQIPAGLWQFFLHFNAVTAGQNWIIRPTVYKRDLGGTETLIFTPDPEIVTAMSTTTTMYVCDGVFPTTTILTTDRIVVRLSMQNTTGVSQTVNFRTEGSQHYSVGLTTLNQVIPTGAVTSVTGTAPIVSSGGLTPAISIAQASAIADGYLSSSDFAVFNAKVGGSGTINYVSKFTGTDTLGNSNIFDNGTNVGIGTITPAKLLDVNGDALINGHTVGRGGGNVATNTVAGLQAGFAMTTASSNSFFGSNSGRFNTTGINLSGIGVSSLYNNTTGSDNVGLGLHTLFSNVTGSNNTSAGNFAGRFLNNGSSPNTTPENSVFLGYSTRSLTNNDTNQIVIGYLALGKGSNTVQLGNTSITNTYLQGAVTVNNAFTLPTTDGTSAQALTTNGSGVVSWTTIASAIPQAQVIYVDSANGINATTGRGDINKPYLTPEYALSNITNTGTFTANTATNTTLSAISDINNALLEIGMYVSGSGIPFGTIIVAKGNQGGNANTVTLSKLTTATATGVTVTWVKTYEVILNGSFIVTSSLFKEGMYINPQSAEISWGAFTLFNIDTYVNKIPYYILGQGNYFGTSISSVFILTNATQSLGYSLSITFGNIETIGTSYCIYLTSGSNENYINIVGNFVNARFGRVCSIDGGTSSVMFNSYGLLGGFQFGFLGGKRLEGNHTTPSSITVLGSGYGTHSLANLTGSTTWTGQSSHRGVLNGTTHTLGGTVDVYSTAGGGTVTVNGGENTFTAVTGYTLNVDSGCVCYAYGSGSYILGAISGSLFFYGFNSSSTISGSGTIHNYGYIYVVSMPSFTGTFNNYGTVSAGSFGGGGNVNNYGSITMIYYGIGVAANKTFVNRGTIISNGSLLNSNAIITLTNATSTFENYGSIINNTTDITKAVIEKTAGKLYLRQGSYLKVANGKSPIKCTANTSASKDVYYFGVTDNCDGTTYGLSIAFDGTSFAPNDLVGGTVYENINY